MFVIDENIFITITTHKQMIFESFILRWREYIFYMPMQQAFWAEMDALVEVKSCRIFWRQKSTTYVVAGSLFPPVHHRHMRHAVFVSWRSVPPPVSQYFGFAARSTNENLITRLHASSENSLPRETHLLHYTSNIKRRTSLILSLRSKGTVA